MHQSVLLIAMVQSFNSAQKVPEGFFIKLSSVLCEKPGKHISNITDLMLSGPTHNTCFWDISLEVYPVSIAFY